MSELTNCQQDNESCDYKKLRATVQEQSAEIERINEGWNRTISNYESLLTNSQHKVKVLEDALKEARTSDPYGICKSGRWHEVVIAEALAAVKDNSNPTLICPRCKVDRFKVSCPGPLHMCPIKGEAQ